MRMSKIKLTMSSHFLVRRKNFLLGFGLLLISSFPLRAQKTNTQLWFEYMLNYPFANSFNLENSFTYSTLLESPRWYAIDYAPSLEWSVTSNIDVIGQVVFSYTKQNESYNTFELRPVIGSRIHITPNKRILTRVLLRLEQRNLQNLETKEWNQVYRPRIRFESIIPISHSSYYKDKLWYGLLDAEWLFVTDDVEERFANRFRVRAGAGYRLNYNLRVELLYMNQQSRDETEDGFVSSDNVIRFRIKHYVNKAKPSNATGTGN